MSDFQFPAWLQNPPMTYWDEVRYQIMTGHAYAFYLRGGGRIDGTLRMIGYRSVAVQMRDSVVNTFINAEAIDAVRPISSHEEL